MATITTDAFAPAGQRHAQALGLPSLPIVTTPHPIEFDQTPALRQRAKALVEEITYILVQPSDKLASEYKDRHSRATAVRSSVPA